MSSSETVKALINQSYKQNRHEDDLNQPRSVQAWGSDADKRRYYLIEGQDDSHFRVYRESNPAAMNRTWWSVAGSIEELNVLVDRLQTKDGRPKSRQLGQKMLQAVPRFEAGEEVSCTRSSHPSLILSISVLTQPTPHRSGSGESTDRCKKSASSVQSLDFRCTRVELEAKGSSIPTRMMRISTPTLPHAGQRATQERIHRPRQDLSQPQAGARSVHPHD